MYNDSQLKPQTVSFFVNVAFLIFTHTALAFEAPKKIFDLDLGNQITNFDQKMGPKNVTMIDNTLYYSFNDRIHGHELWKYDTINDAAPSLLKDIWPGGGIFHAANSSEPSDFKKAGNLVYFLATSNNVREIWVTDGTQAGTHRIKAFEVIIGQSVLELNYNPDTGVTLIYQSDGLWRSDGSASGTYKLFDGYNYENMGQSIVGLLNGKWYITVRVSATEIKHYISDGSKDGTMPFVGVPNPLTYGNSQIIYYCAKTAILNNRLYLVAYNGTVSSIWESDLSDAGTQALVEFSPGQYPLCLNVVNNKLVFFVDEDPGVRQMWVSDGTSASTQLLMPGIKGPGGSSEKGFPSEVIGNNLYFPFDDGSNGLQLWISDGVIDNTHRITGTDVGLELSVCCSGFPEDSFYALNNKLIFSATDPVHGEEYWSTDGTTLELLADLYDSRNWDAADYFLVSGDVAYIKVTNLVPNTLGTTVSKLWISDGSANGTKELAFIPTAPSYYSKAGNNGFYYFNGAEAKTGQGLWKTDGTENGSLALDDNLRTHAVISFTAIADHNNSLYFAKTSYNGTTSRSEVFKTNGSNESTHLMSDLIPSHSDIIVSSMKSINNRLLLNSSSGSIYVANNDVSATVANFGCVSNAFSPDRYVLDGDIIFCLPLMDVRGFNLSTLKNEWSVGTGVTESIAKMGDYLYISAEDSPKINGHELYRAALSNQGIPALELVKNIRNDVPGDTPLGSVPKHLSTVNDKLFFTAMTDTGGEQLWVSDGSDVGTTMITEITYNRDILGAELMELNGSLLFTSMQSGNIELWTSNGSLDTTAMVKSTAAGDIGGAKDFSEPRYLTKIGNIVYFSASGANSGRELWRSDGTAQGSYLVKDIAAGPESSEPQLLTPLPDQVRFLFLASDGISGYELWISDGTEQGTQLVADLMPGIESSGIHKIAYSDGYAYVEAINAMQHNAALFAIGVDSHTFVPGSPGSGAPSSNSGSSGGSSSGGGIGPYIMILLLLVLFASYLRNKQSICRIVKFSFKN